MMEYWNDGLRGIRTINLIFFGLLLPTIPLFPGPDLIFKGKSLFRGRRAPGPDRDDRGDTSVQGCGARAGRTGEHSIIPFSGWQPS